MYKAAELCLRQVDEVLGGLVPVGLHHAPRVSASGVGISAVISGLQHHPASTPLIGWR
jgi:hypothetical protein